VVGVAIPRHRVRWDAAQHRAGGRGCRPRAQHIGDDWQGRAMTTEPDDVPEAAEQLDQIQSGDSLLDRGVDDVLGEGYTAAKGWSPAEKFGNTAYEEATGETLDQRIAQEEPEVGLD